MGKQMIFYIPAFFLLLFSCQEKPSTIKPSFDYIDISFNNGTNGIVSVLIDSTKVIKVHILTNRKESFYYQDTLQASTILTLNHFAETVIDSDFDSIIGAPSAATVSYYLILANKKQTTRVLVYQDKDYPYRPMDSLTKAIFSLTKTIDHNSLDTHPIFKSYKKVIEPPFYTEPIKFIPPVLKDE